MILEKAAPLGSAALANHAAALFVSINLEDRNSGPRKACLPVIHFNSRWIVVPVEILGLSVPFCHQEIEIFIGSIRVPAKVAYIHFIFIFLF